MTAEVQSMPDVNGVLPAQQHPAALVHQPITLPEGDAPIIVTVRMVMDGKVGVEFDSVFISLSCSMGIGYPI